MDIFNKHQLIPVEDGYHVILYLNKNATEFSSDLDANQKTKLVTMDNAIQIYIKEKIPKRIVVKSVQIMMGTILLTTISIMGNGQDKAAASTSTMSTTNGSTYTVVAGDSLWGIANRYGITVNMLKSTNGLTTDILRIGQTLVIPSTSTTSESNSSTHSNSTYQVVAGDTLWGIAKKFGTTVEAIQKTNQLTTTTLSIGQIVLIPTSATNPTPPPVPAPVQTLSYTVKAGDSLYSIARQFSSTVDKIKQANQLTTDIISIGQTLIIPTSVAPAPTTSTDASAMVIQKQLQSLGYYAVPTTTGTYDSGTMQALKNFQSDYGLNVTGTGDTATVEALQHALVKKELVRDTNNYIGVPYLWGGTTPAGFDCSGFVYFMFNKHGVEMSRSTSSNLYLKGTSISRSKLQPGDLVFYAVNSPGVISHVGFYVGDNKFVSATSSKGIQVVSLDSTYWSQYYVGAKRIY